MDYLRINPSVVLLFNSDRLAILTQINGGVAMTGIQTVNKRCNSCSRWNAMVTNNFVTSPPSGSSTANATGTFNQVNAFASPNCRCTELRNITSVSHL